MDSYQPVPVFLLYLSDSLTAFADFALRAIPPYHPESDRPYLSRTSELTP